MVAATFFGANGDFLALFSHSAADIEMSMEFSGLSGRVSFLFQRGNGAPARSLGFRYGDDRVAGVGKRVVSVNLFLSKLRIHGNIGALPSQGARSLSCCGQQNGRDDAEKKSRWVIGFHNG